MMFNLFRRKKQTVSLSEAENLNECIKVLETLSTEYIIREDNQTTILTSLENVVDKGPLVEMLTALGLETKFSDDNEVIVEIPTGAELRTTYMLTATDTGKRVLALPSIDSTAFLPIVAFKGNVTKEDVAEITNADSVYEPHVNSEYITVFYVVYKTLRGLRNWIIFLDTFARAESNIWLYFETNSRLYIQFSRALHANTTTSFVEESNESVAVISLPREYVYQNVSENTLPLRIPVGMQYLYFDFDIDGIHARKELKTNPSQAEEIISLFKEYNNEVVKAINASEVRFFLDVSNHSISTKKRFINLANCLGIELTPLPKLNGVTDIAKVDTFDITTPKFHGVPNVMVYDKTTNTKAALTAHPENDYLGVLVVPTGEMKDAIEFCKHCYYPLEQIKLIRHSCDDYIFFVYF